MIPDNAFPSVGAPLAAPLPSNQPQAGKTGAFFYAALLKAGVIDCNCEVCAIVKRMAKVLLAQVEADLNASDG